MVKIEITLGDELFAFTDFGDWVRNASRRFSRLRISVLKTVAIDQAGRICATGNEFMKARDESAFPVRVFSIVPEESSHGKS